MDWIQELGNHKQLKKTFTTFLEQYGLTGLEEALNLYTDLQQDYICKTKTSVSKIKLADIYYLEIQGHNITVFTQHGSYRKYGTLCQELKSLSPYGFIKCSQSCIVSLRRIRSISKNGITLFNNVQLHMSQHYAPKVIMAYSFYNKSAGF